MSMIAYLHQISSSSVEVIQEDSSFLDELIDAAPETQKLSATALEVGKDWHGIHYLLTGQA